MIFHCTKALAAKLPEVSLVAIAGANPLGCWHAHLHAINSRQYVMFCHDSMACRKGRNRKHYVNLVTTGDRTAPLPAGISGVKRMNEHISHKRRR